MKKIYTAKQLIERLEKLTNTHTVYASGAFGASIADFPKQLERYRKNTLATCGEAAAKKVVSAAEFSPCFAFDCVGMVEAISAWEFAWDKNSVYGGSKYKANDVNEWGAGKYGIITHCEDVSTDFSKIVPGELLWIDGHVGIYIGDGIAVECTTAWTDEVQKTVVTNVRTGVAGEHCRKWTKHGKMPWIDYSVQPEKKSISCPCCGAKFVLE